MWIHTPTPSFNYDSAAFSIGVQKLYGQRVNFEENKKSPQVCKYCMKAGHLIEKFFKLHGFSHHFHSEFKRIASFVKVSDSQSMGQPDATSNAHRLVQSESGGATITKEQFDQLLSLLQQSKMSPHA